MPMGYDMVEVVAKEPSLKVLVVDDSASSRAFVRFSLLARGFEVIEATNGAMALALVEQNSGFAAVLCDLNMPVMNGLVFLERLRATPKGKSLPVFMLSIVGDAVDVEVARGFGIIGWLTKPLDPSLLINALNDLSIPGGRRGQ